MDGDQFPTGTRAGKIPGRKRRRAPSQLQELRLRALELLNNHAGNLEGLRQRVQEVAHRQDPNLRCAIPCAAEIARPEPLDGHYPLPELPAQATIVAADGSQITPDRHAQVNFCLINVGAIQVRIGITRPAADYRQQQIDL